jgi:hypothetical protein
MNTPFNNDFLIRLLCSTCLSYVEKVNRKNNKLEYMIITINFVLLLPLQFSQNDEIRSLHCHAYGHRSRHSGRSGTRSQVCPRQFFTAKF